jgi:hypothetical protein
MQPQASSLERRFIVLKITETIESDVGASTNRLVTSYDLPVVRVEH